MEGLRRELAGLCARLDPDSVPLPEVSGVWKSLDSLERLAAGAKCRLAARVEQSRTWRDKGERSAAEWMAHQSGTTTGRSRACLEASKSLRGLPETDAALAAGELSDQQTEAICGAVGPAGADPGDEARLLAIARRRELRQLREAAARVRARAEDEASRAERLHDQRSLRTWRGADGSWNLAVRNTPEMGAELEAALAPIRESLFQSARRAGRHDSSEAYGADALAELVRRSVGAEDAARVAARGADAAEGDGSQPTGDNWAAGEGLGLPLLNSSRRPDTKVIVLIDHEALKRGWAEADERCEIAGVGPVPVATARSLMADAFGAAVVTNGVDVFSVAHLGRSVTAHQRSALEARGYRCEVPGCGATRGLEIDHIHDWHSTFRTELARLCWLCRRHHLDKTHRGWRLEGPPGDRRWVTPVARRDPTRPGTRRRHDKHTPRPGTTAAPDRRRTR